MDALSLRFDVKSSIQILSLFVINQFSRQDARAGLAIFSNSEALGLEEWRS